MAVEVAEHNNADVIGVNTAQQQGDGATRRKGTGYNIRRIDTGMTGNGERGGS